MEANHDIDDSIEHTPPAEKPAVPVLYSLPSEAVDRAIASFKRRRAALEAGEVPEPFSGQPTYLREHIYDEIDEIPIFYVDGEPLAEYASSRVESLVIEPDADPDE